MLVRDVFDDRLQVPNGSGKSLCYAALPFVFNILRARTGSVVVVVLSAIHNEGSSKYRTIGLQEAFVGKARPANQLKKKKKS